MEQTTSSFKPRAVGVGVLLVLALGAGAYQRSIARSSNAPSSSVVANSHPASGSQVTSTLGHKTPTNTHPGNKKPVQPIRLANAAVSASSAAAPPAASSAPPPSPELTALQAERQAQRVAALKKFLGEQGISEEKTQNAIIEQKQAQENARRLLQEAGHKLFPLLSRKGAPALPEAQVMAQLTAYEQAVKEYQEARRKSAETLDAQISYAKTPRLRAVLVLLGLIGDGPPVLPL